MRPVETDERREGPHVPNSPLVCSDLQLVLGINFQVIDENWQGRISGIQEVHIVGHYGNGFPVPMHLEVHRNSVEKGSYLNHSPWSRFLWASHKEGTRLGSPILGWTGTEPLFCPAEECSGEKSLGQQERKG